MNMKILITGASSYLGARLYVDLKIDFNVVGTYSTNQLSKEFIKLDITDENAVSQVLDKNKPDIIIHVANNANSRWCDANPEKAVLLNQTATTYIVKKANNIGAKLIYISSMGAINPTNIYGKTKLESEKIVKTARNSYLILRPSLILGYSPNETNDRPFNRLLKNLGGSKEAIYDTSWKFQPTYIRHIGEVIASCIKKNIYNQEINIAVPEMKSRFDTAKDILTPFGIKVSEAPGLDSTFKNFKDDLSELNDLNLPKYAYRQMIEGIIFEIKNKSLYRLD